MKVVGIICEYNPLHVGHVRMMQQLRADGAEAIVCAMSGSFVQRGELAVVNKFARSEMAVRCGANLVLELPTPWSCATAETFARGGVRLLVDTGVVTELAFGSECGDLAAMQAAAQILRAPDFPERVRNYLSGGVTYAAARQMAAAEKLGEKANILTEPNNILGIEYLKALAEEENPLCAVTVRRMGAAHDGGVAEGIASASYLRQLLRAGQTEAALALMPPEAAQVMRRELAAGRAPVDAAALDRAMVCRLRQMTEEDFLRYDGGNEGLYHRFYRAVRQASSVEEICCLAKTRRYPLARLRRMVLAAWLNLEPAPERPPYLRVLAANETGRRLLHQMKKSGARVLTKPADVRALGGEAAALFEKESRRTDLYTMGYPKVTESVCDADWRATPLML
ncbi:MAG: nucleotidyltransferase family protein [Clostridiales bacterium]|nr:nucleotidyltransferase family protein [Candidatus Cacconaster stercorequi]